MFLCLIGYRKRKTSAKSIGWGLFFGGAAGVEPAKGYDYVNLSMINTGFGHRGATHSYTGLYESGGKNGGKLCFGLWVPVDSIFSVWMVLSEVLFQARCNS